MKIHWDSKEDTAYIEEKLNNGQTIRLSMSEWYWTENSIYFNTCLALYSKRKQAKINEDECKTTGKDTFLTTWTWTKQAFFELERWITERFNYLDNIIIYINWADNRRRDIYYHFLSRYGYQYGKDLDNKKVIYKKIKTRKD